MSKPSRSLRTQAIILKRQDFGEADRLVTLLTRDVGKRDAIAKGARKPASTKTGHVELFTKADVLVHQGRELGILVQAEMVEPYLELREDLSLGAYASYCAELLDRFTEMEDDDSGNLFYLLDTTFARLCTADDPRLAVRYYEMRLLDSLGFRPELRTCVVSQESVIARDQFFSYGDGGVVRPEVASEIGRGLVPIPLNTLKVLRHLQRSAYDKVEALQLDKTRHNDVERIMVGYITHLLESKLQSVDFIRRLRQMT